MNGVSKTRTARGAALLALVALCLGIGSAHAAFPAANGLIVFAARRLDLRRSASDGTVPAAAIATGNNPAVSPDGDQIAYDRRRADLTMIPIGGGHRAQAAGPDRGSEPAWSRDTLVLHTGRARPDVGEIMKIAYPAGGTATDQPDHQRRHQPGAQPSRPNGTQVAFASNQAGPLRDLCDELGRYPTTRVCCRSRRSSGNNTNPTWSPDGTTIAFVYRPRTGTRRSTRRLPTVTGADSPL